MKKSAFISDVFFAFFIAFVFTLCLFRYLKLTLPLAIFLALLCGSLTGMSIAAWLQSKRKTLYLKKSDEIKKEKLLLHLALLSDEKLTEFFQKAIPDAKRFSKLRLYTQTEFYFLKFTLAPVTADDVIKYARWNTGKQKILFCSKIEPTAEELCQRLNLTIRTGDLIYALLKELDAFPETFLGETSLPKEKRKRLWFAKSNGKRFLVSGTLILLLSLLTPFPYYYFIFGSILLFAAAFIRIFGYEG